MTADLNQLIDNARNALRNGDKVTARRWAEQAARLAPEREEPWLLLVAASEPRESLGYAKRALVVNPQSERARKAVDWARSRLGEPAEAPQTPAVAAPAQVKSEAADSVLSRLPQAGTRPQPAALQPESKPEPESNPEKPRRSRLFPILLFVLGCAVLIFAAWSVTNSSALAALVSAPQPTPTLGPFRALADLAKPTYTPEWTATPSFTPTATVTPVPSATATPEFTSTPENTATPLPTETPMDTPTPGLMEAAIVPDTPTPVGAPTRAAAPLPAVASSGNGVRWIDVDLSAQRLYAYEGDVLVNSFLVSTGTWRTPTVTGQYHIYVKYRSTTMTGPGYNLPNVPFTMYFYKGYGIHGTYWHHNFGTPMSHGCVNLSIPDSEWMYNFASVGTLVNVHY